jgi:RNA polymerase sigma-70 factor, ECF subfamily
VTLHDLAGALPEADFVERVERFRAELTGHCRRLTSGSGHDAEDLVQETFLRAWRSYGEFEGRSSLRTWLYRIATNVCLTALESGRRLPVPAGLPGTEHHQDGSEPWPAGDLDWRGEALEGSGDPAAIIVTREDRKRALALVWGNLSPRQRAVLILRDVLCWHANEIADLLGTSGSAVHSMLRRARVQLTQATPDGGELDDLRLRGLLGEYAAAFETGDINALVYLLTEDAVCRRRPSGTVLAGREAILRFLEHCPAVGDSRMVPISVNGKPGFGVYRRDGDETYRAYTIDVLTITASGFERIEVLEDRALFGTFGLPLVLADERGER